MTQFSSLMRQTFLYTYMIVVHVFFIFQCLYVHACYSQQFFFLNIISEFNAPQSPQTAAPSAEQSEASSDTGVNTATIIAGVIAFMIVLSAAGAGFIYYRSQKRQPTGAAKRAAAGKRSSDAGSRRGSLGSRGSSASLGSVASVGSVGSMDTVATPGRHIHVLYI